MLAAVFAGCCFADRFERLRHVALIVEPGFLRDVRKKHIGGFEQFPGVVDPRVDDVSSRRHVKHFREIPLELAHGIPRQCGEHLQRQFFREVRLDVGGDAFELTLPFVFRILKGCHSVKTHSADDGAFNVSQGKYAADHEMVRFIRRSRFYPVEYWFPCAHHFSVEHHIGVAVLQRKHFI